MKIIQRGTMKILPGKMAEAMELLEKHTAIASRYGAPPMKAYRRFMGHGDVMHTLVFEGEWDSLATMAAALEKMMADPEMQALMPKWDTVIETHEVEFLTPLP